VAGKLPGSTTSGVVALMVMTSLVSSSAVPAFIGVLPLPAPQTGSDVAGLTEPLVVHWIASSDCASMRSNRRYERADELAHRVWVG